MSLLIDNCRDADRVSELLEKDSVYRLVRELNFKYGLKVFSAKQHNTVRYTSSNRMEFFMCHENGLPVGRVGADTSGGVTTYYFRTPYYHKERASDSADRETIHSIKVSTLMNTLKKNDVVPSQEKVSKANSETWDSSLYRFRKSYGDPTKNLNFVNVELVQNLLIEFLKPQGVSGGEIDRDLCKKILDNYITQDTIQRRVDSEVERFFGNFYAVGMDSLGDTLVGRAKLGSDGKYEKFIMVDDFRRNPNLEEYPDILSALTMLKVHAQESDVEKLPNGMPFSSRHWVDLDMLTEAYRKPDEMNLYWILIPCSTNNCSAQ